MSNTHPTNPYTPPKNWAPDVMLDEIPQELEYGRSISYVFDHPNWLVNLLAIVGCYIVGNIIPVLPVMVLMGYQFEIVEALLARPNMPYPDFKFDQIMRYLMRGLHPFVAVMVGAFVGMPVILLAFGVPFGLAAALLSNLDENARTISLLIMIPIGIAWAFVLVFFLNLLIIPMILRAGLAQDIGSAFNFAFIKDFSRRMWRDVLYAGVFLICAGLVAYLVGLLMFCVGIFFTIAVVQLAQAHLGMQLYRIYLLRGGEQIMPKPTDAIVYP